MLKVAADDAHSTVVLDGYPFDTPESPWRLKRVEALDGFRLFVTFRDGVSGFVEMRERVSRKDSGVFRALADPAIFADVSVIFGVARWGCGVDLAPDAMHDAIEEQGVWVLR